MATEFPEKLDRMKLALAYVGPVIGSSLQAKDIINEIQKVQDNILDRLDQSQRDTVEAILEALDAEECQNLQLQDRMKETLEALAEMIAQIKKKEALDSDPTFKEKVKNADKVIADYHANLKRKLEFTIPLIPVLLNYKWDVELDGGDINLRAAWNKLRNSLRI